MQENIRFAYLKIRYIPNTLYIRYSYPLGKALVTLAAGGEPSGTFTRVPPPATVGREVAWA